MVRSSFKDMPRPVHTHTVQSVCKRYHSSFPLLNLFIMTIAPNKLLEQKAVLVMLAIILLSCQSSQPTDRSAAVPVSLAGTWQLLQGTTIENGDTVVTDYTQNVSFIKIINETHFAFLQHDLTKGRDSAAVFVAGGGKYILKDSVYTEHLAYCSAREWEGNEFAFIVYVQQDTLIQQGIEKVKSAGVNRINIEKYIRVKN